MGLHIDKGMSLVNFCNTHDFVKVSATLNDFVFGRKKANWLIFDRDEIIVYKHVRRGVCAAGDYCICGRTVNIQG